MVTKGQAWAQKLSFPAQNKALSPFSGRRSKHVNVRLAARGSASWVVKEIAMASIIHGCKSIKVIIYYPRLQEHQH